ncbi:MAG: hypothetical protein CMJ24_00470 [Phycisphaerae bacterium]|nr:hypothetical protein [Phycisphaerae bacterium]|tara:strand:- start:472 stop:1113 length:642 start_codon:yes stop_codon:yes gene_type:complete
MIRPLPASVLVLVGLVSGCDSASGPKPLAGPAASPSPSPVERDAEEAVPASAATEQPAGADGSLEEENRLQTDVDGDVEAASEDEEADVRTFQGFGATRADAIRSARSQARRRLYDQVESWADSTRIRAREAFAMRNSGAFSSHMTLASDAMLESWVPDVTVDRLSDGEFGATIRIDEGDLKDRFRSYAAQAAGQIAPGSQDAFRIWCQNMSL